VDTGTLGVGPRGVHDSVPRVSSTWGAAIPTDRPPNPLVERPVRWRLTRRYAPTDWV